MIRLLSRKGPQLLLRISAAGLLGVAVVFALSSWLRRSDWRPPLIQLEERAPRAKPIRHTLNERQLAAIWSRDLRQPLFDPTPTPKPTPKREEPKLDIELVATAIEADRRFAVFRLPDQTLAVRAAGAELRGFEIQTVERGQVTLVRGDREWRLRVAWYDKIAAVQEATFVGATP
ncbi:MAG: hypothetical protein KDA32_08020 [Phycisphaerales bacterium]|nr:hypothetical protein [Phycisphaerales bacterium]